MLRGVRKRSSHVCFSLLMIFAPCLTRTFRSCCRGIPWCQRWLSCLGLVLNVILTLFVVQMLKVCVEHHLGVSARLKPLPPLQPKARSSNLSHCLEHRVRLVFVMVQISPVTCSYHRCIAIARLSWSQEPILKHCTHPLLLCCDFYN